MVHAEKSRSKAEIQRLSLWTAKPSVCIYEPGVYRWLPNFPRVVEREPEVELHPPSDTHVQSGFGPAQPPSPAVDEIRHGVMLAEGGRVKVHADLHVVPGHDPYCSLVFILKDLPLQGGTQEQHEVIWQDREIAESPSPYPGFQDAGNSPHKR